MTSISLFEYTLPCLGTCPAMALAKWPSTCAAFRVRRALRAAGKKGQRHHARSNERQQVCGRRGFVGAKWNRSHCFSDTLFPVDLPVGKYFSHAGACRMAFV
ncbi:MAG: hypothetical protein R3F19_09475 [Verrucomicrobiales bacterium]